MTDDDSWIELSAAIRNVVALLTNKKATSDALSASEVAVSEAAGVQLTEGGRETLRVDFGNTAQAPWDRGIETPATLELGNE